MLKLKTSDTADDKAWNHVIDHLGLRVVWIYINVLKAHDG